VCDDDDDDDSDDDARCLRATNARCRFYNTRARVCCKAMRTQKHYTTIPEFPSSFVFDQFFQSKSLQRTSIASASA